MTQQIHMSYLTKSKLVVALLVVNTKLLMNFFKYLVNIVANIGLSYSYC